MNHLLDPVSQHIAAASDAHQDARSAHSDAGASLQVLGDKIAQAHAALAGGEYAKAKRCLGGCSDEIKVAQGHHAAVGDSHRSVSRCLDSAKRALERAASSGNDVNPIANPTAAMGAQTSNGREPRSLDPEVRRQRDQLAGCELGYAARLGHLRRIR